MDVIQICYYSAGRLKLYVSVSHCPPLLYSTKQYLQVADKSEIAKETGKASYQGKEGFDVKGTS